MELKIGGRIESGREEIADHIVDFYKSLYTETDAVRPTVENLGVRQLPPDVAGRLEQSLTMQELKSALDDLEGDKSPGPDGLPMIVYRILWDVWSADILEIAKEFCDNNFLDWRLNCTYVTLIPKIEGQKSVGDFRPISLLTGVYKIIAKALANRLKNVMDLLVSEFQSAGVPGRQTYESALVANELLESRMQSKEPGVVYKLDFKKAFDCVSWGFLENVMQAMGFGIKWCKWMRTCWSTAHFSVLVNGVPKGHFESTRGLRQGDPLSPMLFVIAAEILTKLVMKVQEDGLIHGFCMTNGGERIPILQYADDTIIFAQDGIEASQVILRVLRCFEALSGLHVNCHKSKVFFMNEGCQRDCIINSWGCLEGSFPDVYLGIPFGSQFKRVAVWQGLIDRFRTRLAHWKRTYLSKGGRVVLLRSTLASLPVHMMTLMVMPRRVAAELEAIMRAFLWGSTTEKRKYHLLNWDEVCTPVKSGGLGMKRLEDITRALLAKWLWEVGNGEEKLWKRLIVGKYGWSVGQWMTNKLVGRYGMGLWKGIYSSIDFYRKHTTFVIGNGFKTSFWQSIWLGSESLCELYPSLYSLSRKKEAMVVNCVSIQNGQVSWNLELRRRLSDAELAEATSLVTALEQVRFSGAEDVRLWDGKEQQYTVRVGTTLLQGERMQREQLGLAHYIHDSVWRNRLPPKVCFFMWCATRGIVLTQQNLKRRGSSMSSRCVMCRREEESLEHLLVSCRKAQKIWDYFYGTFGETWSSNTSIQQQCSRKPASGMLSEVGLVFWESLCHAIYWCIWLERNKRTFEERKTPTWRIVNSIKELLWKWNLTDAKVASFRLDEVMCKFASIIRV